MEFVIATQAVVIVALSGLLVSTHARLFRAAMSRTPGEFRKAEATPKAPKKAPVPSSLVELDEDMQAVLEAVTSGSSPMPHGLGGF